MDTVTRTLIAVIPALLLSACGGDGSAGSGAWEGTVTDSAGITVVRSPAAGIWGSGEEWTVEEIFRVGGMEADTAAQFASVVGVDVDPEGRVYVADQQARVVRVFDPRGTLLRVVGAPGEGPGEFGPAMAGVFVSGSEMKIPDLTNQRVNVFTLEGDPLTPIRVDLTGGIPLRWDETPDGELVAQLRGMDMEGMAALEEGDPIATVPGPDEEPRLLATLPRGQTFNMAGETPTLVIFESEPVWDLGGGGWLARAMNSDYRIEFWRDGAPVRVVTRAVEPVEVTEMEERRIREMTREMMMAQGAPPQAVEPILQQMRFAETYPVFGQFIVAEDGSLWVQRIRTSRDVPEGVEWSPQDLGSDEWDVFDDQGRYLGVVTLPLRFQPLREVDGVLWGVERDEFDVQSVVGYRIVHPG